MERRNDLPLSEEIRSAVSEGGHADFGPRDALEDELNVWLRAQHGRVSYERLLSGPGLARLYRFLRATGRALEITTAAGTDRCQGDPFALLDELLQSRRQAAHGAFPFPVGAAEHPVEGRVPQVRVADDPREAVPFLHDRQVMDPVRRKQPGRLLQGRPGRDGDQVALHPQRLLQSAGREPNA
jgi:hypothetical protein